jgi:N-alpha-acetyltransferase 30
MSVAAVAGSGASSSASEGVSGDAEIAYVSYGGEHHLPLVMSLVDAELSEPYSIFTYRYFVYLWPQLTFLVRRLRTPPLLPSPLVFSSSSRIWMQKKVYYGFLTVQAFDAKEGKCVGTVVCKMGEHRGAFRGYIAMLVVLKPYRGRGIGDTLLHYLLGSKIVVTFSVVNKELSCILWICKVALHCKLD